jgi:hypothetical protein
MPAKFSVAEDRTVTFNSVLIDIEDAADAHVIVRSTGNRNC